PAQVKAAFRSFDLVLSTANGTSLDLASWLSMVAFQGVWCTVGLPDTPLQISAFSLTAGLIKVTGSSIGGIDDIKEMLSFCAEKGVRPIIEKLPMAQANEGIKRMREGAVRYRVVLENSAPGVI